MPAHRECFVGTRPWVVAGEGPAFASAKPISVQGFNEGTALPNTAEDMRFTQRGNLLYVIVLGKPGAVVNVRALGNAAGNLDREISAITMLGETEPIVFERGDDALVLTGVPDSGNDIATVFRLELKS